MSAATDEDALEALRAHNLKLLETGDLSDFSVVCGDRTWKAHKNILCRVGYFKKAITSGFQESQENQINIPNFQPFEIDLLLQYIYHPRVDAEVARLRKPGQTFLETCVRLWQLGDYYGIETLAKSAGEQLQKRIERYIAEAGHVAHMLEGVPFVSDLTCAIRAAWDPEKAPGPHRKDLLLLCKALAPYLRRYPGIVALFDEIPEFASEFSKAVLDCGFVSSWRFQICETCGHDIHITRDDDLRDSEVIFHPIVGGSTPLNGTLETWYCSRECYEGVNASVPVVNHDHCEICKRQ